MNPVTWLVDPETNELVGSCCGARLPNDFDGILDVTSHVCQEQA